MDILWKTVNLYTWLIGVEGMLVFHGVLYGNSVYILIHSEDAQNSVYILIHSEDAQSVLKCLQKSSKVQGFKRQGLSIVHAYNICP